MLEGTHLVIVLLYHCTHSAGGGQYKFGWGKGE